MKHVVATSAAVALLVGHQPAHAQPAPAPLAPTPLPGVAIGARVRADAPPFRVRRLDGTVVDVTADTVAIARDGRVTRLPVMALSRLEVYRGRDRKAGARRGALWGTGVGFFMGALTAGIASAHSRTCTPGPAPQECEMKPWPKNEMVAWTAVMTGTGTLYGAGIGALVGRQRWDRALPPRATLAPVPGGIGVRIAFGGP